MGKLNKITYELRDVAIEQAPISFCNHRGDVNPYVNICGREVYPIFVSPMAAVTDENNYMKWIENGLTPIIPRSVQQKISFNERMQLAKKTFVSISLKEAQDDFIAWISDGNNFSPYEQNLYICIDIAHGTLSELYSICRVIKDAYPEGIEIMTGNIASLDNSIYDKILKAGIDWVRVGIGNGSRCTTSCAVGVHVGLATLIDELNSQKKKHISNKKVKIIADGGIGWYDDINKSIALGADAVMCGKIFAECEEACGKTYQSHVDSMGNPFPDSKLVRDYAGMSHRSSQKITGGDGSKVSEGIVKPVEVKYPVSHWITNMDAYLRSAMTYTNSKTIDELRTNAQVIILGGSGDSSYRK